jgi:ABC-2 type transport system ATP-binding protein
MTSYSKGMRQKVAIAIAIAKKADCIFMDEPTSGLDPKATNDFITICKKLAKNGTTIFMATHDIFNAVNVANTIGIMREGILVNSIDSKSITASALEKLYLETI